ncbi:MAG TPA: hypothetical protein VLW75_04895 [Rhizomicrobium sp.]|nr:hypothetical protein [Rhizomicrobium sp.]
MTIARAFQFAFLLLPLAVSGCAADEAEMAQVTNDFYSAYMSAPHDGIPDDAARDRFAPYITPALSQLLAAGDAAEARYAKETHNESPPIIEGDLFTSLFEGATAFKVGACKADDDRGRCAVFLTYDDKSAEPVHWTDTAILERTQAGWRIDDIAYGGKWKFGNRGKLTETLKFALKIAAEPQ